LSQDPFASVERIDDCFDSVPLWLTSRFRGWTGKENDDTQFEYLVVLRRSADDARAENYRAHQTASRKSTIVHGFSSHM
jgi:hypothetical protein